jgi:protein O-GlcNAc transferase
VSRVPSDSPADRRIAEGRALHRTGDLAGAVAAYASALAADPDRAEAWHLKSVAEHQAGLLDDALASVGRALAAGGEQPAFLLVRGEVLHDRGDVAGAEATLARAAALRPRWAAALVALGRVRLDQGKLREALADFQGAVDADPRHVRAWNNLGIVFQNLERLDEAVRAFDQALAIDPRYALAHFNLARIHKLRGAADRALEHAQVAVREDPGLVEGWLLIGDIHDGKREMPNAFAAFTAAVQANPASIPARMALAGAVAKVGGFDDARKEYRLLTSQFPSSLRAALAANLLLPQVYGSVAEVERIREEYDQGLARLVRQAPAFRLAGPDKALAEATWSNFYLAYQGRNDVELQRRYGELLRGVLAPAMPQFFVPRERKPGRARIRVGFLSHFFFNCTAGRYFSSWITHLDRERFETFVYYTNDWMSDDTRAIAAAAGTFRHRPGRSLHALAQEVAHDELDVLVHPELGMHTGNFTLGALRLAPVQCAGWGHPSTTGHPEIDWFVSCEAMEPPDAASHYTERLALLPGLGTRYPMQDAAAEGTRADFGLPEDRTLYLVPQSLFKIHPDNDALIAEVLERDPRGIAVMFASQHDRITGAFAGRLSEALAARGLDLRERVVFSRPVEHATYLGINRHCDVMLDTVHWSGGNTSLDALAMGVPVVTRPGGLMRGRQSQAMLRILGVPELVADDFEGHVETTVAIGRDPDRRRALSERILARREDLFGRDEPVRALEDFLARAAGAG